MMEFVKEWLRTILYMDVLLLVCDSLIQKTKYEVYFRFFSGFLMMLCLVKPLIDLTNAGEYLDVSTLRNQLKNEWGLLEQTEDLESWEDDFKQGYEKAIESQVEEMAASFFIEVTRVEIDWEKDGEEIKSMKVEGKTMEKVEEEPQISSFHTLLMEYYALESADIEVETDEVETDGKESYGEESYGEESNG